MKKFRGIPKSIELEEAEAILGEAPETEFSFLLIPMGTYKIALEAARRENLSVVEVFQKSLLEYFYRVFNEDDEQEVVHQSLPEPTIVMRRKSKTKI